MHVYFAAIKDIIHCLEIVLELASGACCHRCSAFNSGGQGCVEGGGGEKKHRTLEYIPKKE